VISAIKRLYKILKSNTQKHSQQLLVTESSTESRPKLSRKGEKSLLNVLQIENAVSSVMIG
jgi:hypothetical protein